MNPANRDHPALYCNAIIVKDSAWIWENNAPEELDNHTGLRARVKYRHVMSDVGCTVFRYVPYATSLTTPGINILSLAMG